MCSSPNITNPTTCVLHHGFKLSLNFHCSLSHRRIIDRSFHSPTMASTTSFSSLILHHSVPISRNRNNAQLGPFQASFTSQLKPTSLNSLPLKKREAFSNGFSRMRRNPKQFIVRCADSSGKVKTCIGIWIEFNGYALSV